MFLLKLCVKTWKRTECPRVGHCECRCTSRLQVRYMGISRRSFAITEALRNFADFNLWKCGCIIAAYCLFCRGLPVFVCVVKQADIIYLERQCLIYDENGHLIDAWYNHQYERYLIPLSEVKAISASYNENDPLTPPNYQEIKKKTIEDL